MAIREVLPLNFLIKPTIISLGIFFFGCVLILLDLLTNANCIKTRVSDLLVAFIIICCISSLINIKYGIFGNVKLIAALIVEFFLFFSFSYGNTKEEKEKKLNCITSTLIITWAILSLISVLMYFFSLEYVLYGLGSWGKVTQGYSFEYNRLWGIFQDPNYASFISIISILSSVRLGVKRKNALLRILLTLNIILQISYILLGGSRAGLILLFASISIILVWGFVVRNKNDAPIKQKLKGAMLSALSICICVLLIYGLKASIPHFKKAVFGSSTKISASAGKVYDYLYDVSGYKYYSLNDNFEIPENITDIDRLDLEEDSDVSNGRLKRWKHTLSIFIKTPIIGTSPRNVSAFAQEHNPETLMALYGIVSHNGYLDILVQTGIVGFVTLLAALLSAFLPFFSSIFRNNKFEDFYLFCVIFVLAASAVFISDIYMIFSMGAFLFWLFLGFAYTSHSDNIKEGICIKLYNRFKKKDSI
ncbi:MAG: O-antigen ligase family protein [Clostridia bacterium]|nr:O-antigen ligase family protein [Clostridia bacterium]